MSTDTKSTVRRSQVWDILLRIGYGISLVCISYILWIAHGYVTADDGYTLIGVALVIFYALLAPTFLLLILGKKLPKTLRFAGNFWLAVVVIAGLILGYGVLKDAMGIQCAGFFGTQASCVDNQLFLLFFLVLIPYSMYAWLGVSILVLCKGWYDYFAGRRTNTKQLT